MTTSVGLVGCGGIAAAHVAALRRVGFDVSHVVGRPGSANASAFGEAHGIPLVCPDLDAFLDEPWDAAVVLTSVEALLPTFQRVLAVGRPVLVEKPVALRADDLPDVADDAPVQVGYNRRFYESVAAARGLVAARPPTLVEATIPESIAPPGGDPADRLRPWFANSVHVLDLLRHLLGPLSVEAVERPLESGAPLGVAALLGSASGSTVQLTANWGSPDNFRLTMHWPDERYELRPLERGIHYRGMDRHEPTADRPYRTYHPHVVDEVESRQGDLKPGFLGQAEAFAGLVAGRPAPEAAVLDDARAALRLAAELAGGDYRGAITD